MYNPYIEAVKRFLIDTIKQLESSMEMKHEQAQDDAREAITFCRGILSPDAPNLPIQRTVNVRIIV